MTIPIMWKCLTSNLKRKTRQCNISPCTYNLLPTSRTEHSVFLHVCHRYRAITTTQTCTRRSQSSFYILQLSARAPHPCITTEVEGRVRDIDEHSTGFGHVPPVDGLKGEGGMGRVQQFRASTTYTAVVVRHVDSGTPLEYTYTQALCHLHHCIQSTIEWVVLPR